MLLGQLKQVLSGVGKGTGNGHYDVRSGWNGYWRSISNMIGLVRGNSEV